MRHENHSGGVGRDVFAVLVAIVDEELDVQLFDQRRFSFLGEVNDGIG